MVLRNEASGFFLLGLLVWESFFLLFARLLFDS
jgi:hypothetical protein